MYVPKLYRNTNFPEIEQFLQKNSFASLISVHEGKPWTTHIPLELQTNEKDERVLWGHLSRANPQWKSFEAHPDVLAVFMGPHTYISSSWYDHVNVPTWNYIAVHVTGKVKIVEGEQLYESLKRLVNKYEAVSKQPVSIETMPQDYVRKEMKGVVGLEISIDKMEGNWKLSQNRDDKNYVNIISELEKLNELNAGLIAEAMKKMRP
ncbi:MAG: FMN-binding negative transcriptional regulator [Chitinophagaceae bacterium]|nr:FMN-binding negative transcriptional regulator [Chitinophagaceae bacterium]